MNVNVTITGTSPLLMHGDRLANPFDPLTRQMKELSSLRKKTDENMLAMADIEVEAGAYVDAAGLLVMPTYNVRRSFVDAGRLSKLGKAVERAFNPLTPLAPFEHSGPREWSKCRGDARYRDVRTVKIGTSRVLRARPMFVDWSVAFPADLDDTILNLAELRLVAERAGAIIGLGDFRQMFGRYEVEIIA